MDNKPKTVTIDLEAARGGTGKAKPTKAAKIGQDLEPGTIIRTRSGSKDYVIQDDGSRRAIPAGSGEGPQLWAPKLASRAFVKAINAPPAQPGIAERILAAPSSQEAAAIMLKAFKELPGASSGTRRKWRRALEGVKARELHERFNPKPAASRILVA